jgi:putative ABC transport system ATP-binding protein
MIRPWSAPRPARGRKTLGQELRSHTHPVFALHSVRQVKGGTEVLAGLDLEIPGQAITALVGPSGAGKTSLLRLLNRLDDPVYGEILYHERPLTEIPVRELRCRVGFVFQTPVMFSGTVRDDLRVAAELASNPAEALEVEIRTAMELAELDWELADRDGERLSVGQKQRATIARALMTRPEVLLMDEPTSALDPETADRLTETIRHLSTDRGLTVVMVTHRLAEARRASDFTVVMEAGRVIEAGLTPQVFGQSEDPRIRAFLESGR